MKRANKHSAISIHDYPRNNFFTYWETQIHDGGSQWGYETRFIDYATGNVLSKDFGKAGSENEARAKAQEAIVKEMPKYRRERPLLEITDEGAAALRDEFDECRQLARDPASNADKLPKAFARIDAIRGLLRANGFQLGEKEKIAYAGKTELTKVGG